MSDHKGKGGKKKKTPAIWGSLIRVRSHRYGTLKLRGLTIDDLEFIEKLLDLDSDPRSFAVRVLQHQLLSPQLSLEEIQRWSDKLLVRVIFSWAKHKEAIEQHIPEGEASFEAFQHAISHYINERREHLRQTLESIINPSQMPPILFSHDQLSQTIGASISDFARFDHSAIAQFLDTSRPFSNYVEQMNVMFPNWLGGIQSTHEIVQQVIVPDSFIHSHLAEIAKISTMAGSAISDLDWTGLGSALRISDYLGDALKASFFDFSQSYSSLYESLFSSSERILSYSPQLTKLPAIEYFRETDLLEAISVEEADSAYSEEKQQLREVISAESDETIRSQLLIMDKGLVVLWEGAVYSIDSNNPDRIRHTATSLRELFTHVLHRLAPDEEVRKWTTAPEHYDDKGRPTRRARLLYICRDINQGPFALFVEKDVNAALEFIQLFQRGTHEVVIPYTQAQLVALKARMESLIRFLIEISQQNK